MGKVILLTLVICFLSPVEVIAASTENNQASTPNTPTISQPSGVTIDLTSVVVTALTLGFGYGVLKTFQSSGYTK